MMAYCYASPIFTTCGHLCFIFKPSVVTGALDCLCVYNSKDHKWINSNSTKLMFLNGVPSDEVILSRDKSRAEETKKKKKGGGI